MPKIGKNKSLKRFIILWMSFLVSCFGIITLTLILSTNRLQTMSDRIFTGSMALDYAHRFEIDILEERRADLLWRSTRNDMHYRQRLKELQDVKDNFRQLDSFVTTSDGQAIIEKVEEKCTSLMAALDAVPPADIEIISSLTDSLLVYIEKYRAQKRAQMVDTINASDRLNVLVDRCSLVMIVLVALMVATCSVILIRRIIHPVFGLIRTSRKFGEGDFEVRAPVLRNDEIGDLCQRFNEMAGDIQNHFQSRHNFIATVAHDLKNPLVVVGAAARRLNKEGISPEERLMWINYIIQDVDYLENLIGDLMDTVQIETGNFTLKKTDLDLTSLVSRIHQRQQDSLKSHRVEFEGEGECWIHGDLRRLERVVLNLLSNSVKYSPVQTTVLLKVERNGQEARLVVRDQGFGIEEGDIAKIFLPFKRSARTQGIAEGSGLGLFSVKKIVDGHGGRINVTSQIGRGTSVEIVFPLSRTD